MEGQTQTPNKFLVCGRKGNNPLSNLKLVWGLGERGYYLRNPNPPPTQTGVGGSMEKQQCWNDLGETKHQVFEHEKVLTVSRAPTLAHQNPDGRSKTEWNPCQGCKSHRTMPAVASRGIFSFKVV